MADLNEELQRYLIEALYAMPALQRRNSCWVMDGEWLRDIHNLTDSANRPIWEPSIMLGSLDLLLGLPIEIREDGGAPHLEVLSG